MIFLTTICTGSSSLIYISFPLIPSSDAISVFACLLSSEIPVIPLGISPLGPLGAERAQFADSAAQFLSLVSYAGIPAGTEPILSYLYPDTADAVSLLTQKVAKYSLMIISPRKEQSG